MSVESVCSCIWQNYNFDMFLWCVIEYVCICACVRERVREHSVSLWLLNQPITKPTHHIYVPNKGRVDLLLMYCSAVQFTHGFDLTPIRSHMAACTHVTRTHRQIQLLQPAAAHTLLCWQYKWWMWYGSINRWASFQRQVVKCLDHRNLSLGYLVSFCLSFFTALTRTFVMRPVLLV